MRKLKILTFGTENYLKTYSKKLEADCKKFAYDFDTISITAEVSISTLNHTILNKMIEYVSHQDFDRLCFMDPECRIIKEIPSTWIENNKPVVFYKIRNSNGTPDPKFVYKNKDGNGERLPCRIIGQPMFINKEDNSWLKMTLDLSLAASDPANKQYTRNEMFIETALEYCKIDCVKENILYNRHTKLKNMVVKGTWETEDTIIKHPDIYSIFDHEVSSGNPYFGEKSILDESLLTRHTSTLKLLESLNKCMWLESTDKWLTFDCWKVQPSTGKIMLIGYKTIKYHHTIQQKLDKNINTPAVDRYVEGG